jgi:hypothetical protein
VSQRHADTELRQTPTSAGPVDLGRQRHDAHVGRMTLDDIENICAGELRGIWRLSHGARRHPQARQRLCAVVVGIDEIAFQVRR